MLSDMTEPQFGTPEGYPPPGTPPHYFPPQDQSPPPGPYGPPPGQFPPPYYPPTGYYPYSDPMAPYGRHPVTGEPFSDKSKVVAGLLQLLGLVGVLGIGRIYIGQTTFGVTQLVGCLLFGIVTCGIGFIVSAVWGIVDAVLIFTDRVRDASGRPLRDG
jgi:TM2 domain-containing membrane protein YozV